MRTKSATFDKKSIRYRHTLTAVTKFLKKHIFLIVTTLAVWVYFYGFMSNWSGHYQNADSYMHALRLHHWLLAPSFAEQPILESNYPFGEYLHWTRPMDVLWLLFTLPFWFLDNIKDVIFISGAFIAPILGVLTAIVLAYGLRRQFNVYLIILGCTILFLNQAANNYFLPSHPDHHALMIMLSVYASSLVLCWMKKRQNRYLRILGIILALMTFTAIEGILLYAMFLCFFLYLFIYKNVSLLPAVKTSKYFAIALTIFWFINPPHEGWFYPDNGRISILYAVIAWLSFIGFWVLDVSHLHTAKIKLLSLLCMALGFALSLIVIFGLDVFNSPIEENIRTIFTNRIPELYTIKSLTLAQIIAYYVFPLAALAISWSLAKKRPYKRLMILNLCLGIPLFFLSLIAVRFSMYQPLYIILPFVALVDYLYKTSDFAKDKKLQFPGYLWGVSFLILMIEQLLTYPWVIEYKNMKHTPIFAPYLCQQVKNIGGTLLTDIFISPRYVWSCDVSTVGTPYHHNVQGISDTYTLLNEEVPGLMIPLTLKHQLTQILLFDDYAPNDYALTKKNQNKLYYRLIKRQNVPPFLSEVKTTLPNARLYEVKI